LEACGAGFYSFQNLINMEKKKQAISRKTAFAIRWLAIFEVYDFHRKMAVDALTHKHGGAR